MIDLRRADIGDLGLICSFTDWWLSGRGKRRGVSGAVDDCFISPSQHKKYITKYQTVIGFDGSELVCWAVVEPSNTMIHLLIHGNYRRIGIGRQLVEFIRPKFIRSKKDQSSGNPRPFYEKMGYSKIGLEQSRSRFDIDKLRPFRKPNIDIFVRSDI